MVYYGGGKIKAHLFLIFLVTLFIGAGTVVAADSSNHTTLSLDEQPTVTSDNYDHSSYNDITSYNVNSLKKSNFESNDNVSIKSEKTESIQTTNNTTKQQKTATAKQIATQSKSDINIQLDPIKTVSNQTIEVNAVVKTTSGSKVTFTFTPETGYSYSSVTCTNGAKGTYNKDTNKLAVNYIKGDTSCTVVFKKASYAVTIKATNGTVGDSKIYVEVGGLSKATVKPKTGYQFSTVTCTNGLTASYAGEQLTVGNATKTGTCTVKFVPQQFLVIIKDNAGNNYLEGKYDYKSTKATFSIKTTTRLNKQVTCNGTVYTASEYSSTSGGVKIYKYSVGFPVTSNVTCTYTIR